MASSNEIFLKWNGHHDSLVPMLYSQLEKKNFVDVTIEAEGKSVSAHRLILSAASDYFEELLGQNHKLAVVTLTNMKFCDVQSIIEYIYKGEISLSRDQLGSFLATASSLKIKGLAQNENNPNQAQEPTAPEMPFAAHLVSTGSIRTYQEEEEESVHDDPFHQMIQELEENLNHRGPLELKDPDVVVVDQPPRPAPVIVNLEETMIEEEQVSDDMTDSDSSSNSSASSDSSSSDGEEGDSKEGTSATVAANPIKSSTQPPNGNKADSSLNKIRFNCDRCGKGFGYKRSLVKHTYRTLKCRVVPWFRCALCGQYIKKRRLVIKQHLSRMHGKNVEFSEFDVYIV